MSKGIFHWQWHRFCSVMKSLRFAPRTSRSQSMSEQELMSEFDRLLRKTQEALSQNELLRIIMECENACDQINVSHDLSRSVKVKAIRVHLGAIPNLGQCATNEETVSELRRELQDTICNMKAVVAGEPQVAKEQAVV